MRALAKLLAVAVLVASPAALAQRAAPGKTKTPAAAPARAFVKITKEELEKMALAEITALGAKPGSRPTRGARLMEVPNAVIQTYIRQLWDLDPASLDAP